MNTQDSLRLSLPTTNFYASLFVSAQITPENIGFLRSFYHNIYHNRIRIPDGITKHEFLMETAIIGQAIASGQTIKLDFIPPAFLARLQRLSIPLDNDVREAIAPAPRFAIACYGLKQTAEAMYHIECYFSSIKNIKSAFLLKIKTAPTNLIDSLRKEIEHYELQKQNQEYQETSRKAFPQIRHLNNTQKTHAA